MICCHEWRAVMTFRMMSFESRATYEALVLHSMPVNHLCMKDRGHDLDHRCSCGEKLERGGDSETHNPNVVQ